jgi:CRISPR/Cas system CMR subunit Cmr4 (Cas7 group RAMP superfamily)
MIESRPIHHLARLTLEAETAHGFQSGRGDNIHDVLLVRDANGLPAIPGTSLAGVLRHAYARSFGEAASARMFGSIGEDGHPSPLIVDWGLVHDSQDRPREGLLDPEAVPTDPLLAYLQQDKPVVRQRVRLNHRGAAADTGKFDVTLLPAGVRYTHWLRYWCDGSEESMAHWQRLMGLLAQGGLQLGHGTRSGNGHFRVHQLETAAWDLRTGEGRTGFSTRPRLRQERRGLGPARTDARDSDVLQVELHVRAEAGWRIGGGERSLSRHDREPDLLPQHEPSITWRNGQGRVGSQLHLLPGSALKGALRHRVAYHYRRLNAQWADATLPATEDCPAVRQLFGSSSGDTGEAGQLVFRDLLLPETTSEVLMHNRIDRFTGGVMHGALFSEEVLWETPLVVRITVLARREVEPSARQALDCALRDLAKGWLALGAGGARGLGSFVDPEGRGPVWSDGGAWVNSGNVHQAEGST